MLDGPVTKTDIAFETADIVLMAIDLQLTP
jgi:cation transport ATPase